MRWDNRDGWDNRVGKTGMVRITKMFEITLISRRWLDKITDRDKCLKNIQLNTNEVHRTHNIPMKKLVQPFSLKIACGTKIKPRIKLMNDSAVITDRVGANVKCPMREIVDNVNCDRPPR